MRHAKPRRVLDERGQALVEFALILPIILLLVMGMLEFARAWNTRQAVTDAAREGARLAVVQDPTINQDTVKARIATALARLGIPGTAVTIAFDEAAAPGGNWRNSGQMQRVYVGVNYRFGFFGPLLQLTTGSPTIRIASLVTMRNE
jgi:Flp pilus assembly protein TadG